MRTILMALALAIGVGACGGEEMPSMPTRDCDNPPPGVPNCEEAAAAAAGAGIAARKAAGAAACALVDSGYDPDAGTCISK